MHYLRARLAALQGRRLVSPLEFLELEPERLALVRERVTILDLCTQLCVLCLQLLQCTLIVLSALLLG